MQQFDTDMPLHLFHHGENFKAYMLMGAHPITKNGKTGYVFRVWAPHAKEVYLIGSFNNWNETAAPMCKMVDGETYELFVDGVQRYDEYKYLIITADGRKLYKADPYAFHSETPGPTSSNSSKIYDLSGFKWTDKSYLDKRKHTDIYASPVNIYEVNLLSWKKHEDGLPYTYLELAKELVEYVKDMNYTHVEFMPVMEHPFDGSWGYQVTGYYSITSRLGTPHDFMYLIDCFHKAGIGVILDWVPAHFPKDAFGLYEFDGEPLYEPSQWDRKEMLGWGTHKFDYYRAEVLSFLISNAIFYFEQYHVDGLRVDAVSSMLYLDFDKKPGEWTPNIYGENKNLEAIAFLRRLNETVFKYYPNAMMIAEESTAWPIITKPTHLGGLGFNFKWNMGWMNDLLTYVETDPIYRQHQHNKLTFSMMYAFSENYILPISHDEVVHGKKSLIDKMPGSYEEKFSGVRAFLGYMMSHAGKKLNFMGTEYGQFREWAYAEGLEMFLRAYPTHQKLFNYVRELNRLYKTTPALFEIEDSWDGFEWLAADDSWANFISYKRTDKKGNSVIVLVNFSGSDHFGYKLGMDKGKYQVVLNSNSTRFGGDGSFKKRVLTTKRERCHFKEHSITFDIPKMTCLYLIKIN